MTTFNPMSLVNCCKIYIWDKLGQEITSAALNRLPVDLQTRLIQDLFSTHDTPWAVIQKLKGALKIDVLDLSKTTDVDDVKLMQLSSILPNLKRINLQNCAKVISSLSFQEYHQLSDLDVRGTAVVDIEEMKGMIVEKGLRLHMNNLRELNPQGTLGCAQKSRDDELLKAVIQNGGWEKQDVSRFIRHNIADDTPEMAQIMEVLFNHKDFAPNDPIDDDDSTVLHWLCGNFNFPLLQVLFHRTDLKLDVCDSSGRTPLNYLEKVREYYIEKGLDQVQVFSRYGEIKSLIEKYVGN